MGLGLGTMEQWSYSRHEVPWDVMAILDLSVIVSMYTNTKFNEMLNY